MSVLVGLHGEAGSEDTVAKLIIDWCNDTYPTCLPRRYSFAKPVYELASVILGVTQSFRARGKVDNGLRSHNLNWSEPELCGLSTVSISLKTSRTFGLF